jgi:hypothetical protein
MIATLLELTKNYAERDTTFSKLPYYIFPYMVSEAQTSSTWAKSEYVFAHLKNGNVGHSADHLQIKYLQDLINLLTEVSFSRTFQPLLIPSTYIIPFFIFIQSCYTIRTDPRLVAIRPIL